MAARIDQRMARMWNEMSTMGLLQPVAVAKRVLWSTSSDGIRKKELSPIERETIQSEIHKAERSKRLSTTLEQGGFVEEALEAMQQGILSLTKAQAITDRNVGPETVDDLKRQPWKTLLKIPEQGTLQDLYCSFEELMNKFQPNN